jgi:hypothetical protein
VDELNYGGQFMVIPPLIAKGTGTQQYQYRTQALTTVIDDIFADLIDQHDIGVETLTNEVVYGLSVIGDQIVELLDIPALPGSV